MNCSIDRRGFLRVSAGAAAGLGLFGLRPRAASAAELADGALHAEKLGWHLGCQAYSFNRFSFFEAIEKTKSVGLGYIEMYPGQKLSADKPDVRTNESMPAEVRKEVLQRLADAGVKLVNYGVCGLQNNEDSCRRTFEFAKDMGIQTLVSEPPFDAFDLLDKLCGEYEINVALHNHPEPSRYWNPDTVLEQCKGRSKRIGSCADTGHWMRSGINPLDAIRKLEGRIISFHLKDLNKYGRQGAHDVPWGTGKADMEAILAELHRQDFQGVFSIEYEHNWENSVPEIAECVKYFDKVASKWA